MPMDVATAEAQITGRFAAALANAGVAVGAASPLPGLQDPIAYGLVNSGVKLDDPTAATDADVARLAPTLWFRFIDLAVLRLLDVVALAWATSLSEIQTPDVTKIYDSKALTAYLESYRKYVAGAYGVGVPKVDSGTVVVRQRGHRRGLGRGGYGDWNEPFF